jgi:hypothetical protein
MTLTVYSLAVGTKGLNNQDVAFNMKLITHLFSLVNLAILAAALVQLFLNSRLLTILIAGVFFGTFFLAPFLYDFNTLCSNKCCQLIAGIFLYIYLMPMYSIIFQTFAFANWCDITWGNREKSEDNSVKDKDAAAAGAAAA